MGERFEGEEWCGWTDIIVRSFIQIRLSQPLLDSSHEHQNHDENPNESPHEDRRAIHRDIKLAPLRCSRWHPQTAAIDHVIVSLNRYRHILTFYELVLSLTDCCLLYGSNERFGLRGVSSM